MTNNKQIVHGGIVPGNKAPGTPAKKRLVHKNCITRVASAFGVIDNKIITALEKDIVLNRLEKEITSRFHFGLRRSSHHEKYQEEILPQDDDDAVFDVLKSRILAGVNQCTHRLETVTSHASPSIIIIARDVRPPTSLAHIPVIANHRNIPLLVLPGRSSTEMGNIMGVKTVSVLMFLEEEERNADMIIQSRKTKDCHKSIDSFVKFLISKIPK